MNLQKIKNKKINTNSGITLIALIITIILLLILATVSINLVINSGIITKTKNAVDNYSEEEIKEQIRLAYLELQIEKLYNTNVNEVEFLTSSLEDVFGEENVTVEKEDKEFKITLKIKEQDKIYTINSKGTISKVKTISEYPDATPGTATTENSKYISNEKTAVIPEGYKISEVAAEQSIDTGLVIKEVSNDPNAKVNEWVWIPVANVMDLYLENSTNTEWKLCGTDGVDKVVTSYSTKTWIPAGRARVNPGDTSSFREPDTVVGDGTGYDAVAANYGAAGFGSLKAMAEGLKDDYKNMIESVRKYKGFYIGRYELSSAGTKKDEAPLTNTDWYHLYAACKANTLGSSSVVPSMIWGCQWDQVCKFIETAVDANGNQISLADSTKYGNYKNSDTPANGGNWVTQTKQNTGSNEAWKTNNIYDLAGNCWEWTQEASYTDFRANRGGNCIDSGYDRPVTYRDYGPSTATGSSGSSRPILYLK